MSTKRSHISRHPVKATRLFAFIAGILPAHGGAPADSSKHWVGTWGAAPYLVDSNMPPSPGLTNNTLRQIVRVSIGGDTVRLKLTNLNNAQTVTMKAVNLAISVSGGAAVAAGSITPLKFGGSASVTLDPGASATSDPAAFPLTPSMRVAITINYGQTSSNMTGHVASRTNSYLLAGDKTASADFAGAVTTMHWYSISNIDVLAPRTSAAVAIIGNSITDGYGLTDGKQNRWPDMFSESLLRNPATKEVGVLNMGIGATNVLGTGATAGVVRFRRDVLEQAGVRWAIIYHGVNDIGGGATAAALIDGLKTMADAAREKKVTVYGATIMPFNGHSYYTTARESVRRDVNGWIRNGGAFDAVIDFDRTLRNPNDTTRLRADLSLDGLHPNPQGYKVMGESVDPKLFAGAPSSIKARRDRGSVASRGREGSAIPVGQGAFFLYGTKHRIDGRQIGQQLLDPSAR